MQLEPLIVAIGGGKGGVGKSMVSSNLAVQYANAGYKVALLDLDIGASNLHTIFGIKNPPKGLGDYFITPRSQLINYLIPTSLPNLLLAPGSGFVPEIANLKTVQKNKLIHQIRSLTADIVLLDLGAGTSHAVIDFFSMTHYGLIVTSPEPTSIVNAYEFLKNVIYRILFRLLKNQPKILELLKISAVPNNKLQISTIADLIQAIDKQNPWAAQNVREICQDLDLSLIFNQARKIKDAELVPKLHDISQRFLGIDLNFGGMIFYNEEVSASIFKMMPISVVYPDSVTSKTLKNIASRVLQRLYDKRTDNQGKDNNGKESFETQFSRTLFYAKKDYESNILTQHRLHRG